MHKFKLKSIASQNDLDAEKAENDFYENLKENTLQTQLTVNQLQARALIKKNRDMIKTEGGQGFGMHKVPSILVRQNTLLRTKRRKIVEYEEDD